MSIDSLRRRALFRATLLVVLMTVALTAAEAFEEAELRAVDARFVIRGTQPPPPDVVVIAVDEGTLAAVGERWPFSLDLYADAVNQLAAAGAAVIVLDVPFGPGADAPGLDRFLAAIDAASAVVLATAQDDAEGVPVVLGGAAALAVPGVRAADARFDPDDDGVVRRIDHTNGAAGDGDIDSDGSAPMMSVTAATIAVVGAEQLTGATFPITFAGDDGATIDHPGPTGTIDQISLAAVLDGSVSLTSIVGRIAVLGPTAAALQDLHPTPLAERTSGAEIHAAAIATVLADLPLSTPSAPFGLLAVLLVCGAPLLASRLRAANGLILVVALTFTYLVVAQVAFQLGVLLPVVPPLFGLVGTVLAAVAVDYAYEARARRRVREVFGRYVPATVVRDIVESDGDGDLLRATTRDVTVMFSDLRGFTTFSETRDPAIVMGALNRYLGAMTDVVLDEGGQVVGYLGDGLIAVFGAPDPVSDHADRALAAATRMLELVDDGGAKLLGTNDGTFLRTGIGLNSGPVTAGNLGTVRRLAYTIIGDTVNTASRIEGLTKESPYDLLLADATREALTVPPADLVEHATLPVRGRTASIRLWSLTSTAKPIVGS